MISPYTKSNTKVVCDDDAPNAYDTRNYLDSEKELSKNEIYTVIEIKPFKYAKSGFIAVLKEVSRNGFNRGFDIARFSYLELPKAVLECLNVEPNKILEEV